MRTTIVITSVILFIFVTTAAAEIYLWPMHGERRISSSFSEYREGHYHAGVDLRSHGAVGLPCLAVSDGYVSRVRIGPSGYGKALYLKLSDGRTAVYAHLDHFDDAIDSLLWHHRVGKKTSWCDMTFTDDRFSYSVGDTVSFSGDTGTSAPHLHFELRDSMERPLNPLEAVYSIPDRSAPIISGIEAIPLDQESLLDGAPFPRVFLTRASGASVYMLHDTLHFEGRFAFGVSVFDEQGYGSYTMAPHAVSLAIDGDTLYTIRNSSFSYDQSDEVALEYEILGAGPAGRYTLLYRNDVNTINDRTGTGVIRSCEGPGEGICLEMGIHRGEIIASDASGNVSRALFFFSIGAFPVITEAGRLEAAPEVIVSARDQNGNDLRGRLFESLDDGRRWDEIPLEKFGKRYRGAVTDTFAALYRYEAADEYGAKSTVYFSGNPRGGGPDEIFGEMILRAAPGGIHAEIATDRILTGDPLLILRAAGTPDTLLLHRTGPKKFSAMVACGELNDGSNLLDFQGFDSGGRAIGIARAFSAWSLSGGRKADIMLDDTLQATLEAPSVRRAVTVILGSVPAPGAFPAGLKSASEPFTIDFAVETLRRPLELRLDMGRKTGLFRWQNAAGWKCVAVPAMEGGTSGIDSPGIYIFLTDGIPPLIRHAALSENTGAGGFFKPYFCYLPVVEEGSGIDPWSAEAVLNGQRMVCEWDPFRSRLVIPLPAFIEPGQAGLRVEISDRAGNRTVGEFGFMIQ